MRFLPVFQAYGLSQRVLPSLLTRKGPNSVIAPAPIEEHPGPVFGSSMHKNVLSNKENTKRTDYSQSLFFFS